MVEQRNLVLAYDPNQMYPLLAQGYRVLLCTEDPIPPEVDSHPDSLRMSILLPPYEVVSYEINGDVNTMAAAYQQYLATNPSVITIIDIIYLSAYLGNPTAICFGSEVRDLHFGQVLLQYLSMTMGLNFQPNGYGSIETNICASVVSRMYLMNEINGTQALSYYPPNMDIEFNMLKKLIAEFNPPLVGADMVMDGNTYFRNMVLQLKGQATNTNGQQFYSPFTAGPAVHEHHDGCNCGGNHG